MPSEEELNESKKYADQILMSDFSGVKLRDLSPSDEAAKKAASAFHAKRLKAIEDGHQFVPVPMADGDGFLKAFRHLDDSIAAAIGVGDHRIKFDSVVTTDDQAVDDEVLRTARERKSVVSFGVGVERRRPEVVTTDDNTAQVVGGINEDVLRMIREGKRVFAFGTGVELKESDGVATESNAKHVMEEFHDRRSRSIRTTDCDEFVTSQETLEIQANVERQRRLMDGEAVAFPHGVRSHFVSGFTVDDTRRETGEIQKAIEGMVGAGVHVLPSHGHHAVVFDRALTDEEMETIGDYVIRKQAENVLVTGGPITYSSNTPDETIEEYEAKVMKASAAIRERRAVANTGTPISWVEGVGWVEDGRPLTDDELAAVTAASLRKMNQRAAETTALAEAAIQRAWDAAKPREPAKELTEADYTVAKGLYRVHDHQVVYREVTPQGFPFGTYAGPGHVGSIIELPDGNELEIQSRRDVVDYNGSVDEPTYRHQTMASLGKPIGPGSGGNSIAISWSDGTIEVMIGIDGDKFISLPLERVRTILAEKFPALN